MGIINKLTKRCVFCGNKDETKYVPAYGLYGQSCAGNYYHEECLTEVICEPEKYKTIVVDMAIDIVDRIKGTKALKLRREEQEKKRCDYLKAQCIKT